MPRGDGVRQGVTAAGKTSLPADASSQGPLPAAKGAPASVATAAMVVGFAALAACLLLFGLIAEEVRASEPLPADAAAYPFLHGFASPPLDALMNAATFVGSGFVLPPLAVAAVLLLATRRRRGSALFLGVVALGALLLNQLMKMFFQRPRPPFPWAQALADYSFPSGHTMNSTAIFLALAVIIWSVHGRRWGLPALLAAVLVIGLIAVSRVYLGFHYLSDVAGGLLAGVSWLLIVIAAFRARSWLRGPGAPGRASP